MAFVVGLKKEMDLVRKKHDSTNEQLAQTYLQLIDLIKEFDNVREATEHIKKILAELDVPNAIEFQCIYSISETKLQEDGLLEPELSRRNKWFRLASADLAQRKKDSEALRRAVEQQRLVVDGIREKRSRFPLNVMRLARAKKAVRNRLARFQKNAGESGQKKRKTTR